MEVSDYLSLFNTFDVGNTGRLGKIGSGQQKICIGWKDLGGWSAGLQAAVGCPRLVTAASTKTKLSRCSLSQ